MKFQNLNKKLNYIERSRNNKPNKKRGKFLKIILIVLALVAAIYFPVRGIYNGAREIRANVKLLSQAAQNENLDEIRSSLKKIKGSVSKVDNSLDFLFWVRLIPYVGGFYSDGKHFTRALGQEMEMATTLADSLDPYKSELGLVGTPTPGQDKVSQMVKILDKVIPQLDKVEPNLKKASDEVSSIDVDKYPEKVGKFELRRNVALAKDFLMGAYFTVSQARPALEAAPSALGEPVAKNYLIIFQNDKELRPTGGFMTAYAFLKLDKGRISSSFSDDIYRLDERLLAACKNVICPLTPPEPISVYLPEVDGKRRTAWSMRDSNFSPDVPTSLATFEKMYSFLPDGEKFDGIILIDTKVVEELIKITGPIEVLGTTYSASLDERCDCSNVIYELENYAQVIEKGEADRKAILGTLMQQILARSLGASTEKLPQFIDAGVRLANTKHVIFYMHEPKLQAALANLNWTGKIKDYSGDYLHINDTNLAGGKSNLYVTAEVLWEIDTKQEDSLAHKLTINYKNPLKYSAWLNAINRDYLRIYVPQGSVVDTAKGFEKQSPVIDEELGKSVFPFFLQVRPQNSVTLMVEYTSPVKIENNELKLLIQKQPGSKDHKYRIKVNGKEKAEFNLDADKELKISL